jgi:type II secretory pathway pseudopilin PulG
MLKTNKQQGFSLIETMLVLFLSVIIVFMFAEYLSKSFRSIKFVEEFGNAVDNASKGAKMMNKILREATTPSTGVFPLISAGENELIFYSNNDDDTDIERIRFFLEGTILKQGVIQPTGDPAVYTATETITTISQYVQNTDMTSPLPIFTYFDLENNETPSINAIKRIHTHLEINETPERAPKNFTIDINIQLRNLK